LFGILNYGTFVISFVVLLLLPGPGNFALVAATGQGNIKAGLAAISGVLLGDQVLMWLALAGIATVLQTNPHAFLIVKFIGGSYLAYLGFMLAVSDASSGPRHRLKPGHYFRQTLIITLLNPKTVLFYMAYLPLFVDPMKNEHLLTFFALAITVSTLTFLYGLVVIFLTHYFANYMQSKRRLVSVFSKVAGVCLIAFGAKLFFL
jgi:leucine efflux protein